MRVRRSAIQRTNHEQTKKQPLPILMRRPWAIVGTIVIGMTTPLSTPSIALILMENRMKNNVAIPIAGDRSKFKLEIYWFDIVRIMDIGPIIVPSYDYNHSFVLDLDSIVGIVKIRTKDVIDSLPLRISRVVVEYLRPSIKSNISAELLTRVALIVRDRLPLLQIEEARECGSYRDNDCCNAECSRPTHHLLTEIFGHLIIATGLVLISGGLWFLMLADL
jgi:hypothetical protein